MTRPGTVAETKESIHRTVLPLSFCIIAGSLQSTTVLCRIWPCSLRSPRAPHASLSCCLAPLQSVITFQVMPAFSAGWRRSEVSRALQGPGLLLARGAATCSPMSYGLNVPLLICRNPLQNVCLETKCSCRIWSRSIARHPACN